MAKIVTRIKKLLLLSKLLRIYIFVLFSGCSYMPAVIYDGDLYMGVFRNGENEDVGCEYSYIQGGGVKLSLLNFGFGYFSNKKMEVDKEIAEDCKREIAEIFFIDDDLAEEVLRLSDYNVWREL